MRDQTTVIRSDVCCVRDQITWPYECLPFSCVFIIISGCSGGLRGPVGISFAHFLRSDFSQLLTQAVTPTEDCERRTERVRLVPMGIIQKWRTSLTTRPIAKTALGTCTRDGALHLCYTYVWYAVAQWYVVSDQISLGSALHGTLSRNGM